MRKLTVFSFDGEEACYVSKKLTKSRIMGLKSSVLLIIQRCRFPGKKLYPASFSFRFVEHLCRHFLCDRMRKRKFPWSLLSSILFCMKNFLDHSQQQFASESSEQGNRRQILSLIPDKIVCLDKKKNHMENHKSNRNKTWRQFY